MPLIKADTKEEKHLVTIMGFDKIKVFDALHEHQGVCVQSVEAFCQRLRYDVVSRSRKAMEVSETEIHPIPYVFVRQANTQNYLVYRRPDKYGVGGLEGKHSIGFAGHVDLPDFAYDSFGQLDAYQTLVVSLLREMDEELLYSRAGDRLALLEGPVELGFEAASHWANVSFKGLMYDQTDTVGLTHLGVIAEIVIDQDIEVAPGEDVILNPHWASLEEIFERVKAGEYHFENWSLFILEHLLKESEIDEPSVEEEEAADLYCRKYRSEEEVVGWNKTVLNGQVLWEHPELQSFRQGYLDRIKEGH